jgi:hypothetical protein
MKPALLLRIASIISLLFAVLHTLGASDSWSPVGETDVLRAMRSYHFNAGGVSRTYLDFYLGLGLTVGLFLLLQAVLLWQLAALARIDPVRIRPMIAAFFVASMVCAFLSWKFIFAAPAIFSAVIAVLLGVAFYAAGKGKYAQQAGQEVRAS